VLIADDHEDARYMYESYLRSMGIEVVTASSGREAFVRTLALQPDVVVMDVEMPVLSGDRATALIKQEPATRHIPVIAMTAFGANAVQRAEAAGCDLVCEKPLLPDDLFSAVQSARRRACVKPTVRTRLRARRR
jgi:two-component system cell cycle response regulator DivK